MCEEQILTKEIANQYLMNVVGVDLSVFTRIENAASEVLSKSDEDLYLDGITNLSAATAECLSRHKGTLIDLDGLTTLPTNVAKHLCRYEGDLRLSGLSSLSKAAARCLCKHKGILVLEGITEISDSVAEILSEHKGDLYLDGITSLSDAAANSFSECSGNLELNGITHLSPTAIALLSNHIQESDLEIICISDDNDRQGCELELTPLVKVKTGEKTFRYNYDGEVKQAIPSRLSNLSMQDRCWLFYDDHYWLEDDARRDYTTNPDGITWWPCDKSVRKGEIGLVYSKAPVKSIVAVVEICSACFAYEDNPQSCVLRFDTILNPMLVLNDMRDHDKLFEAWGLLRSNMQNSHGPRQIEKPVLRILRQLIPQLDVLYR